jgi:hypothetical protein
MSYNIIGVGGKTNFHNVDFMGIKRRGIKLPIIWTYYSDKMHMFKMLLFYEAFSMLEYKG